MGGLDRPLLFYEKTEVLVGKRRFRVRPRPPVPCSRQHTQHHIITSHVSRQSMTLHRKTLHRITSHHIVSQHHNTPTSGHVRIIISIFIIIFTCCASLQTMSVSCVPLSLSWFYLGIELQNLAGARCR